MRNVDEVVDDIKSILNNIERTEECYGETLVEIDELSNEILAIYHTIRNKAIDEAMETAAKAICIGCGYLEGIECSYKGSNCRVSKPMLESVIKALERMKGGSHDQDM